MNITEKVLEEPQQSNYGTLENYKEAIESRRFYKMMGFALIDLKSDKNIFVDARINPDGFLGNMTHGGWSVEGFIDYCNKNCADPIEQKTIVSGIQPHSSIKDFVEYDKEFGLPNVLMIIPPTCANWVRADDNSLDFYEETVLHHQENRMVELDRNICPYDGWYMDKRSGKKILEASQVADFLKTRDHLRRTPSEIKDLENLNEKARIIGFENAEDARLNLTPWIPTEVQLFCKYLNLFTEDRYIFHLKPIIYVCWRMCGPALSNKSTTPSYAH